MTRTQREIVGAVAADVLIGRIRATGTWLDLAAVPDRFDIPCPVAHLWRAELASTAGARARTLPAHRDATHSRASVIVFPA